MSKIDLSKANVGDKFRTRNGKIVEYAGEYSDKTTSQYILKDEGGLKYYFYKDGNYMLIADHKLDLVEQVLDDEKYRAITDKILKDEGKVANGVAEAMPFIDSDTPREQLPENNEDDAELQRRKEVVELAEKMYIMFENEMLRYNLERNGISTYSSEKFRESAIIRAASFIIRKQKYLKDGKLC